LSIQPSALAVARHYADLLDGFVFDKVDSDSNLSIQEMNITTLLTNSIMEDMAGRRRLAKDVIDFVNTLL